MFRSLSELLLTADSNKSAKRKRKAVELQMAGNQLISQNIPSNILNVHVKSVTCCLIFEDQSFRSHFSIGSSRTNSWNAFGITHWTEIHKPGSTVQAQQGRLSMATSSAENNL